MKTLKRLYGINFTVTLILLVFGIILFFRPETTINLISYIIGGILIIMGIPSLIKYFQNKINVDLIYGAISIIAGLILILNPSAVVSIMPFVLGIYFIISGISKCKYALDIKKYNGNNYISLLITSILIIICGLIFVINPFKSALAITKIIGVFLIIYSVLDIINYLTLRKDISAVERIYKIND